MSSFHVAVSKEARHIKRVSGIGEEVDQINYSLYECWNSTAHSRLAVHELAQMSFNYSPVICRAIDMNENCALKIRLLRSYLSDSWFSRKLRVSRTYRSVRFARTGSCWLWTNCLTAHFCPTLAHSKPSYLLYSLPRLLPPDKIVTLYPLSPI